MPCIPLPFDPTAMPKTTNDDPEINWLGILFLLMIIDGSLWHNFSHFRVVLALLGIGLAVAAFSRAQAQLKSRRFKGAACKSGSLMASIGGFLYFVGALIYAIRTT